MRLYALPQFQERTDETPAPRFCEVHPEVRMVPPHDPFPAPLSLVPSHDQCWRCCEEAAIALRDVEPLDIGLNRAI